MFHVIPLKPFSRLPLFDQLPWPKWNLRYSLLRTQYISWQWFSSYGTWSGRGRGKSLGVDFLQINCGLTWTSPWIFWMGSKCSKRLTNNVTYPAWFFFFFLSEVVIVHKVWQNLLSHYWGINKNCINVLYTDHSFFFFFFVFYFYFILLYNTVWFCHTLTWIPMGVHAFPNMIIL